MACEGANRECPVVDPGHIEDLADMIPEVGEDHETPSVGAVEKEILGETSAGSAEVVAKAALRLNLHKISLEDPL